MKFGFLFTLVSATLGFAANAKADDCAALVGRIVQQEDAQFEKRSPSGNIYFLKHRLSNQISVDCGANSIGPMITVDFDKVPFPSESMFLLAARLGSMLSGTPQPILLKAIHRCHQEALKETQAETAEMDLPHGVQVECQAFTRGGGPALSQSARIGPQSNNAVLLNSCPKDDFGR